VTVQVQLQTEIKGWEDIDGEESRIRVWSMSDSTSSTPNGPPQLSFQLPSSFDNSIDTTLDLNFFTAKLGATGTNIKFKVYIDSLSDGEEVVSKKSFPASDTSIDKVVGEPSTTSSILHYNSTINLSTGTLGIMNNDDFVTIVFERDAPASDEYSGDVYLGNVKFCNKLSL